MYQDGGQPHDDDGVSHDGGVYAVHDGVGDRGGAGDDVRECLRGTWGVRCGPVVACGKLALWFMHGVRGIEREVAW